MSAVALRSATRRLRSDTPVYRGRGQMHSPPSPRQHSSHLDPHRACTKPIGGRQSPACRRKRHEELERSIRYIRRRHTGAPRRRSTSVQIPAAEGAARCRWEPPGQACGVARTPRPGRDRLRYVAARRPGCTRQGAGSQHDQFPRLVPVRGVSANAPGRPHHARNEDRRVAGSPERGGTHSGYSQRPEGISDIVHHVGRWAR